MVFLFDIVVVLIIIGFVFGVSVFRYISGRDISSREKVWGFKCF